MEPLIAELVVAIAPLARHPFALFGHSMGALVAFELARALAQKGLPPACLFVSGRRAPQLPDPEPPLHQLADGPFVGAMVRRYNAIPQAILAETELLRLFLPTLRADFELLETYHYHAAALLPCPIVAFGGSDDPRAARAELAAWQHQTVGRFEMEQFPGDHFYLNSARSALLAAIVAKLQLADAPQSLAPGRLIPEF
jgi:medium-chain acyl-[acyl-carrier-protein] hydrolase